jgi:hypothetical protein
MFGYLLYSYLFFKLQAMHSTLASFVNNVWLLLLYSPILVLLIHLQQLLSISSGNHLHTMIGNFLLSASVISNIKNSGNSHSGVCLPSLCLIIQANKQ